MAAGVTDVADALRRLAEAVTAAARKRGLRVVAFTTGPDLDDPTSPLHATVAVVVDPERFGRSPAELDSAAEVEAIMRATDRAERKQATDDANARLLDELRGRKDIL